jgi:hypothetical protein
MSEYKKPSLGCLIYVLILAGVIALIIIAIKYFFTHPLMGPK